MASDNPHPPAGGLPVVGDRPGIPLRELLIVLGSTLVDLLDEPAGDEVVIRSVALVDGSDLAAESGSRAPGSDLYLHVGVTDSEAAHWLRDLAHRPTRQRPRAVLSKTARQSPALRQAAREVGVAVVAVHPQARWGQVYPLIRGMLDRGGHDGGEHDLLAADTDLFGLAQTVARNAGGMVTVEDAHSRVLAYSASNDAADRLRIQSILGREGPREYLRILQRWGVFDRLRNSDEVIDLPAHPELDIKHRLAVGIRRPGADSTVLGTIWLQEGEQPFAPEAAEVLRGAAAIAARIISRTLDAPSTEALLVQRLFGARGSGVDVPSLAGALNIPMNGPAAVIGFAISGTPLTDPLRAALGSALRLRASAFRGDSLSASIGDRAYVLLPHYQSARAVTAWTRQLVERLESGGIPNLRAAIAIPVADLTQVARARGEVDRVLDSTAATYPRDRVTTLAESRTAVLLGEILDLIAARPELHDPRLTALFDYDRGHAASLCESAEHYLRHHGDVRAAAEALRIHPNTLRYRLRRVQDITGIDLEDPADRLLLELQLARHRRTTSDTEG
ncbi:PucR family transcriptional regulator [Nocardia sp. NBC_00511]|uniref:PucR family transcriptional regulator n=1 Tax=Nocardia sp. NBC_00511 TaxID=2903591 RepID=UPI0030E5DBD5